MDIYINEWKKEIHSRYDGKIYGKNILYIVQFTMKPVF